jgi:hypothetical protein
LEIGFLTERGKEEMENAEEFFGKIPVRTELTVLSMKPRRVLMPLLILNGPKFSVHKVWCLKCKELVDFKISDGSGEYKESEFKSCPVCGGELGWQAVEYGGSLDGAIFVTEERREE